MWGADSINSTTFEPFGEGGALITRTLDDTKYQILVTWQGDAQIEERGANYLALVPKSGNFAFTAEFAKHVPLRKTAIYDYKSIEKSAKEYWNGYWSRGGAVDFSLCTDPRASELERRVVLSQYLLAIQCAGQYPPQETGLTYNSWFGKFHLEMIWWHQAQFALWGHEDMLARTMKWYHKAEPMAREIAKRQGFEGVRWMKMTDPQAGEAPSKVGSFLIWQQPHLIYLTELIYRANPSQELLQEYYDLVQKTAEFIYSFADYDAEQDRYILKGIIPAQETLRASETVNPPFELSYWHYSLSVAQKWRERMGRERVEEWDVMLSKLSHLASKDGLYLAAETAPETYQDVRFTSDHMAVLGAVGILPASPLLEFDTMKQTFDWIYDNWNWDKTWGWDYPMTAMCAVRMGEPEKAVNALLMDKRTNTYLVNGHNYQDARLRCYLPGNGGLLTTVALMCAGWDGCEVDTPGFPKDGTWNVRWEGLYKMP